MGVEWGEKVADEVTDEIGGQTYRALKATIRTSAFLQFIYQSHWSALIFFNLFCYEL